MSIVNELQRLSQAKADLKTAIENKGITIEDTATIDTYASKIDEIEVGGGDSFYDTFWDWYQSNNNSQFGLRTDYRYAFYGAGWKEATFKPKYDIKPIMADYMFTSSLIRVDLVEVLENLGIVLDFANCANFAWAFYGSQFSRIGVVDMSKVSSANNANNVFRMNTGQSQLHTIDKLIVSSAYPIGTNSFVACSKLENITIDGSITGNFTISDAPLTVDSMKSIITHLKDYSGTSKEFSYSVKFSSACWTTLEADSTAPDGGTWNNYVQALGWNV